MFLRYTLIVALLASSTTAQAATAKGDSVSLRRTIKAVRSLTAIKIDGVLSEDAWLRAGDSTFTQRDPDEGAPPTQRTEVWVAYDDAALYVAARLYDTSPDSIVSRIARRDQTSNSDWFYFAIDSYLDRRTAFYFGVNPSGSIEDGTFYNDDWNDDTWDGVWDVATRTDAEGWTVEARVPYSQLRFRKQSEQVWGINFMRRVERRKEEDYFVIVPKKESGFVSRFADLIGIKDINPPRRFEILPYAVSSAKFTKKFRAGDPFNDGSLYSGNLGADLKAGLGTNLTLDATINPDFGQVEVDPAVVNLTQYETFYEEKRPFFIEGANIFNFGRGGANNYWSFNWSEPRFFYSRRIGRPPQGSVTHQGFRDVPDRTTILGAAKLSGKITDGWSIGTLSAVTQREYAEIDSSGVRLREEVEPFSYHGVFRTQREFNKGNQALGLLLTAGAHDLRTATLQQLLNRNAFALGFDGWTYLDSSRTWVLTGWSGATRVTGTRERMLALQTSPQHYFQRPDASHLSVDSSATSLTGWGGRVYLNKQTGNTLANIGFGLLSPGIETNDLGFHSRGDVINGHVVLGYQWFVPGKVFRRKWISIAHFRNYDFGGIKTGEGYFLFANGQLLSYWGGNISSGYFPKTFSNSVTRGGPLMENPASSFANFNIYSDSRKRLVLYLGAGANPPNPDGWSWNLWTEVEWKPSTNLRLRISPELSRSKNVTQYVLRKEDTYAVATYGARYVFATLDYTSFSSSIRMDWTFTPKLSLQVYVQPLLSSGRYFDFKELARPGTFSLLRYGENGTTIFRSDGSYTLDPDGPGPSTAFSISNPDFNFKSLRGNAVLRWEYMPGSTLYLVWTQSRSGFDGVGEFRFGRDLSHLFSSQPENAFLVKISYWWNP